ncbi:MAG: hypothetical protein ABW212_14725 [Pseudonocardia sediminis]
MSTKADNRLAEFLRRVVAGGNDAAPVDVIFGGDTANDVQRSMAQSFASSVRDMGHIEPAGGSGDDLARVRVTAQGREWLGEYDAREPTLHPRFST